MTLTIVSGMSIFCEVLCYVSAYIISQKYILVDTYFRYQARFWVPGRCFILYKTEHALPNYPVTQ